MLATATPELDYDLRFDGRDVAENDTHLDDVLGYALQDCQYCGTIRDGRFAFCCELAAEPLSTRRS